MKSYEELVANAVTLATLLGLAAGAAQVRRAQVESAKIQPQAFLRQAQDTVPKTVQQNDLTASKNEHRISGRSSELQAFLKLPPPLRRQLLRYGERWQEGLSR